MFFHLFFDLRLFILHILFQSISLVEPEVSKYYSENTEYNFPEIIENNFVLIDEEYSEKVYR